MGDKDLTSFNAEEFDTEGKNKKPEEPVDFAKIIPPEIFEWLSGQRPETPPEIRKLGDDILTKLNWFIVHIILAQYSRIPKLYAYLQKAEQKIYNISEIDDKSIKEIQFNYKEITSEVQELLEFARKFSVQNKEVLVGSELNPEDRALIDKIRQLPPSTIKKVLEIIEEAEKSDSKNKESGTQG